MAFAKDFDWDEVSKKGLLHHFMFSLQAPGDRFCFGRDSDNERVRNSRGRGEGRGGPRWTEVDTMLQIRVSVIRLFGVGFKNHD